MEHPVQWTAPSPTWHALTPPGVAAATRATFNRPSILRFATDSFMDDFAALLDVDPRRLVEFIARPETWRGPIAAVQPTPPAPLFARALQRKRLAAFRGQPGGATAVAEPAVSPSPADAPVLKLYQPAHQRYYLVTASLVCQLPGLPDRAVHPGNHERATFVIRRLIAKPGVKRPTTAPSTADEYAYVTDATGTGWRKISVSAVQAVAPGEHQLPLFTASFTADDEKRRKILAGLIPVARRETYIHAAPLSDSANALATGPISAAPAPPDARVTLLRQQVTEPWRQLLERRAAAERIQRTAPAADPERESARRSAREQIQTVSWYVLLDLGKYLEAYVPNVWAAMTGTGSVVTAAEQALANAIVGTTFTRNGVTRTMASALVAVRARESQLEAVTTQYVEGSSTWPSELFSLAPVRSAETLGVVGGTPPSPVESLSGLTPDTLDALVKAALPATTTAPMPEPPLATRPVLAGGDPGWFVIRCVYERPLCGPIHPVVLSDSTEVFQLAAFFDSDAPARPIRIGLPLDVSPAGLRKFDKNTVLMMSDMLCGYTNRFKGLTLGDLVLYVLPWPFHKELPTFTTAEPCKDGPAAIGTMCSLSIPIVTICALILLIIIVSLLDFIFKWLPYFIVCFPIPGFKGKDNA